MANRNRTTALLQTSRISSDCEFSDISFQSAAGIYQERVEKEYELRINYFGGKIIAVKLDSQKNVNSKLDWRVIPPEKLTPVIVDLPSNITAKCHTLMANLGLVFGCIDIIVTLNGEYCFLEVNEMGQFLWVEEHCPQLPLLETFSQFLIDRNTSCVSPACAISYAAYLNSDQFQIDWNNRKSLHVETEDLFSLPENDK